MVYFIDKTNRSHSRSMNRSHDFQELQREAQTNPDPNARKMAVRTMETIKKESKPIKDMRESLIKAHRNNNQGEIKDIHDYIAKKKKYHND